jgi:hypothetical protein
MTRFSLILVAAAAVGLALLPAGGVRAATHHHHRHQPAAAAPSAGAARLYIVVQDFNPRLFLSAARTARDAVSDGSASEFRIVLAARGVLLAIPPITSVQKQVIETIHRNPRIQLIACREVVAALAQAAHRAPPLLPGTRVEPCNGMHAAMERAGWQPASGY